MDDVVKFKCDFFDIAIKDIIIDNITLSSDKNVHMIYGWIERPYYEEKANTLFKYLLDDIFIVKDNKQYIPHEDYDYLFSSCDEFMYYVFWLDKKNVNLKDGIYYKHHLVSDKLTSEKTRISKLNLQKIINEKEKEYKEFND